MPIPTKRLVITKEDGIKTESIPRVIEKGIILTKQNKKIGVMKFLSKRAKLKKLKQTQRQKDHKTHQPFKHYKSKGHSFQFRRIETLVKNKHSQMKHWSKTMERRKNKTNRKVLHQQLRNVPILLIVRIHRKKNVPKKLLSQMHRLRLLKAFDAVIIRNSAGLQIVLKDILPFITFGVPTTELIRDLVMKRGRLINEKANKSGEHARTVIKSNVIVEQILGEKYGVICIEDIIHVLSTDPFPKRVKTTLQSNNEQDDEEDDDEMVTLENGEKHSRCFIFDGVANAINPFNLNRITIPMKGLKTPFDHKGYWGYRGEHINTFVEKIV